MKAGRTLPRRVKVLHPIKLLGRTKRKAKVGPDGGSGTAENRSMVLPKAKETIILAPSSGKERSCCCYGIAACSSRDVDLENAFPFCVHLLISHHLQSRISSGTPVAVLAIDRILGRVGPPSFVWVSVSESLLYPHSFVLLGPGGGLVEKLLMPCGYKYAQRNAKERKPIQQFRKLQNVTLATADPCTSFLLVLLLHESP